MSRTNADIIRNMTDEELAEFLVKVNTKYNDCMVRRFSCKTYSFPLNEKYCKDCFKEWLEREVEE